MGENRSKKKFLLHELDKIDRKAEGSLLWMQDLDYKNCLHTELTKLLRDEEIYWLQRSKATKLLYGDDNTKYF